MIALNIDLEIWPTPPLIFTQGVKKCKNWPLRRCGFETLKFRTEFDRGEARLLRMFKVKSQRSRSRGQSSRLQRNVTYEHKKL